jgi:hypothetical protein
MSGPIGNSRGDSPRAYGSPSLRLVARGGRGGRRRRARRGKRGSGRDDCETKGKLRKAVEELSEAEAAEALEILVRRGEGAERDAVIRFLDNAPIDDKPEVEGERLAVAEGCEALRRRETVSLDEINAEGA